ncbi:MAG: lipopolysaccharide transport periplasmic protein LptA [Gammaproteobacteria bacterium]|nr:lipopolysaccharide transport periplasmic protein LptA [Gammaproteobacteria bacterium]
MKSNSTTSNPRILDRLLPLLLLTLACPLAALESDREQPVYVEADGADINDRTGVSVYTGNVVVTQGSIKLNADKVTVTQKEGETDHLQAEGAPVRFEQDAGGGKGLIKGKARKADYYMNSEILHMNGDAVMVQGKDTFSSDRIVYDRVKGQVKAGATAKGKQRVRISIQPKQSEKK